MSEEPDTEPHKLIDDEPGHEFLDDEQVTEIEYDDWFEARKTANVVNAVGPIETKKIESDQFGALEFTSEMYDPDENYYIVELDGHALPATEDIFEQEYDRIDHLDEALYNQIEQRLERLLAYNEIPGEGTTERLEFERLWKDIQHLHDRIGEDDQQP